MMIDIELNTIFFSITVEKLILIYISNSKLVSKTILIGLSFFFNLIPNSFFDLT